MRSSAGGDYSSHCLCLVLKPATGASRRHGGRGEYGGDGHVKEWVDMHQGNAMLGKYLRLGYTRHLMRLEDQSSVLLPRRYVPLYMYDTLT